MAPKTIRTTQPVLIPLPNGVCTKDTATQAARALAAGCTVELDAGGKELPFRVLEMLKGSGKGALVLRRGIYDGSKGTLKLAREV